MVRYSVVDGIKCVDIDINVTLTVDIKGWSRIFQYSNRDLILKEDKRLRLYDAETNNVIAIYEESLNKKPVIRKKL
jgi:hypothetical protein